MARRRLFREEAFARRGQTEPLDGLLRVTAPHEWVIVAGLGIALLGLVAWGLFGSVERSLSSECVLAQPGERYTVISDITGNVIDVPVDVGDPVEVGQPIAFIKIPELSRHVALARARLSTLEANPDAAPDALALARSELLELESLRASGEVVASPYSGEVAAYNLVQGQAVQVGVVMPHGILFRGGAEGKIRQGIVEADMFEAIIGLAPNLFFGASIPVAICVLNKAKPEPRRGKVLFIDAAQPDYFRQGKAQNFLYKEHIEKIVEAYEAFEEVDRFAHVADLDEIKANDFNLNISRYVDTTEPVEVMSVEEALVQLREAEKRRDEAVAKMDALLAELGYHR